MKRLSFLFLLLMMTIVSMGAPVTKQQARQWAQEFMLQRGAQIVSEPRHAPGMAVDAEQQPLYVFNAMANKGFVIIAGDDCAEHVLGYVTEGSFDENNLPDNFRSWLEMTADEIREASHLIDDAGTLQNHTLNEGITAPRFVPTHPAISPLVQTLWNQGGSSDEYDSYIYNMLTPTISGKHCVTGCTATAGAQIMYYYQHPKTATAKVPGYTIENSQVNSQTKKDLPSITFNWSAMKHVYVEADNGTSSAKAVSQLMKYVGWAAHMKYGLDGSSASPYTLAQGMASYFDYDPYTWSSVSRSTYSVIDWDNLIYGELNAGRPVLVSGSGTQGGHAFICDGYDGAGMYHFNWGWGGHYNGYFKLNAMNPYNGDRVYSDGRVDTGFSMSVSAIIGLQPNTGQGSPSDSNNDDTWEVPTIDDIVATVFRSEVSGTKILLGMGNAEDAAYGFGYGMGRMKNGKVEAVDTRYEYMTNYVLDPWSYYPNREFDVSTYGLSNGTHELFPISLQAGTEEWKRCKPAEMYFEVVVKSGQVKSIVEHPVDNLQISDLKCVSSRVPGKRQTMSFTVTNAGDNIKKGLYLFASNTEEKGEPLAYSYVAILAGNTKQRSMYFTPAEAGTYHVWICSDYNGENVLAETTVKIAMNLQCSKITFTGNKYAGCKQPVVATIKSTEGDYTDPLYFFASTSSSNMGSAIYAASCAIESGKTDDVKFYFKPTEAGNYQVWVCYDEGGTQVIGMGTVTINAAPTTEVTLVKQDLTVDARPFGSATLSVKNTSNSAYNNSFVAYLYQQDGESNIYWNSITTDNIQIKKGATAEVVLPFDYLEVGHTYKINIYYYKTVGGNLNYLCNASFYCGNGVATEIELKETTDDTDVVWYTVDGRKLNGVPTTKGVYIRNGKKIIVK